MIYASCVLEISRLALLMGLYGTDNLLLRDGSALYPSDHWVSEGPFDLYL